jgi:hypothetical protein
MLHREKIDCGVVDEEGQKGEEPNTIAQIALANFV